jgi:anaerobic selenocysteine-containing dehydrogenase
LHSREVPGFVGTATLHPTDAQRLGLRDGALADIRSAGAQLRVAAERPGANLNAVLGGVAITMQAAVA